MAWKPTKGGDGGVAPSPAVLAKRVVDPSAGGARRVAGGLAHIRDNEREVIVCVEQGGRSALIPTSCMFDRAHGRRRGAMLMPAARMITRGGKSEVQPAAFPARPRRYPAALLTSSGLSVDSAADALYELQRRLEGIPGIGSEDTVGELSETAHARLIPQRGFPT